MIIIDFRASFLHCFLDISAVFRPLVAWMKEKAKLKTKKMEIED